MPANFGSWGAFECVSAFQQKCFVSWPLNEISNDADNNTRKLVQLEQVKCWSKTQSKILFLLLFLLFLLHVKTWHASCSSTFLHHIDFCFMYLEGCLLHDCISDDHKYHTVLCMSSVCFALNMRMRIIVFPFTFVCLLVSIVLPKVFHCYRVEPFVCYVCKTRILWYPYVAPRTYFNTGIWAFVLSPSCLSFVMKLNQPLYMLGCQLCDFATWSLLGTDLIVGYRI